MRIAVFGDSILWGQGLRPEHKCTQLVADAIGARTNQNVEIVSFARSGADVWHDGESATSALNPIPEQIPPMSGLPT